MAKKRKHLHFYVNHSHSGVMPRCGLCGCAWGGLIEGSLLALFKPEEVSIFDYWASGKPHNDAKFAFTELRQTIVLLMAAINGEL